MLTDQLHEVKGSQQLRQGRSPGTFIGRELLALLCLLVLLILADVLCYQQGLPVELDEQGGSATLHVGSQTLTLGKLGTLVSFQLSPHNPLIHEYQIDGTDSTNNFTLDTNYLNNIASSPYYQFQSWMRNLDGTSRWSNLHITRDGHQLANVDWPANGTTIALQHGTSSTAAPSSLRVQLLLRRPETPMTFSLDTANSTQIQITLDRNDRKIEVTSTDSGVIASSFFPVDVLPFAAMVADTLLRTMAWAVLALLAVLLCEIAIVCVSRLGPHSSASEDKQGRVLTSAGTPSARQRNAAIRAGTAPTMRNGTRRRFSRAWQRLTRAIHPIALVALLGSFVFVAWIARVQYHGEPHIYDASAYLFAAKMYATGHLSVPVPPAADRFPGPFMLQFNGQWFGQYAPGTSLTLVPGIWLGVPWLVEPVLGTLALLGTGLIAARLYDRRVATLAVILGCLSPFYSYLAASYLSHAIALFYLVWGLWAFVRFVQDDAGWNLPLAACFFGMAGLTRDQVAVLFVALIVPGMLLLSWRQLRVDWRRWRMPGVVFLAILLAFVVISQGFNALLTGDPLETPRTLFFAGDHWGFGQGVGFYGQHTLAAGFVNLDELLTILSIDLYGWPIYLTLAFVALPFLTRRARAADWVCLIWAAILIGAYVGYFYHGIYLGPRYLFETLPFLLMLTARGILTLAEAGIATGRALRARWRMRSGLALFERPVSIATSTLVILLLLFNLLYFMPRQVGLHQNYSGLPQGTQIDLDAIYHPALHNALIVTDDLTIYQFVLFPLNDPYLRGNVIYAQASTPADYAELQKAFPGRTLYELDIAPDGSVHYTALNG